LASPDFLAEGLELLELQYDGPLDGHDFTDKNKWTKDVCPLIRQNVTEKCYYYEVFDSYFEFMSNETALDPPHAKCPNTGAISWRKAMTDLERSACYPEIIELNLEQSEQQYDKKLEKYAVIIDEVNMIATQATNISAAMADPPTASIV